MDQMVLALLRPAHARHAEHLIVLAAVASGKITVRDDRLRRQRLADGIRINKGDKAFPVLLRDAIPGIPGEALQIREMDTRHRLLRVRRIAPVADAVVLIKVYIIHRPVV